MSILKMDEKNQIYYEYIEPKNNGYTFIFVNALTGSTTTWNNEIGQKIIDEGNGYLTYNFRGQEKSKFDQKLSLDTDIIVSDLCLLIDSLNPRNTIKPLIFIITNNPRYKLHDVQLSLKYPT